MVRKNQCARESEREKRPKGVMCNVSNPFPLGRL